MKLNQLKGVFQTASAPFIPALAPAFVTACAVGGTIAAIKHDSALFAAAGAVASLAAGTYTVCKILVGQLKS